MVQAIFLDRDGVINRERADYVKTWQEFQFLPGVLAGLARLACLPCPILLVSNQSAIGRGLTTAAAVDEIHRRLRLQVEKAGGRIDAIYVCPHHPDDGCMCRKPKPGLLQQAAQDFHLQLAHCLFVGDALTDHQAALSAGCRSILVETGRQGPLLRSLLTGSMTNTDIVRDLTAALALILHGTDPVKG